MSFNLWTLELSIELWALIMVFNLWSVELIPELWGLKVVFDGLFDALVVDLMPREWLAVALCEVLYCCLLGQSLGGLVRVDDSVEASFGPHEVVHHAEGTIWLHETVLAYHHISATLLPSRLPIATRRRSDFICPRVLGTLREKWVCLSRDGQLGSRGCSTHRFRNIS